MPPVQRVCRKLVPRQRTGTTSKYDQRLGADTERPVGGEKHDRLSPSESRRSIALIFIANVDLNTKDKSNHTVSSCSLGHLLTVGNGIRDKVPGKQEGKHDTRIATEDSRMESKITGTT